MKIVGSGMDNVTRMILACLCSTCSSSDDKRKEGGREGGREGGGREEGWMGR